MSDKQGQTYRMAPLVTFDIDMSQPDPEPQESIVRPQRPDEGAGRRSAWSWLVLAFVFALGFGLAYLLTR